MFDNIPVSDKKKVANALNHLMIEGALGVGGDHFDLHVKDVLSHFTGYYVIGPGEFSSRYPKHKKRVREISASYGDVWDFTDIMGDEDKGLIISQPNGTQGFPDLLLIINGWGMPVEVKSSKTGIILWNSALPRKGAIYVYNQHTVNNGVTAFLGDDVMDDDDREQMIELRAAMKLIADKYNGKMNNGWSMYPRAMHNCSDNMISSLNRDNREKAVMRALSMNNEREKQEFVTHIFPDEAGRVFRMKIEAYSGKEEK